MQNSMGMFTFLVLMFLGHVFGPKIQNCLFKVNFYTYTNSNMPNSMVVFIASVLDWKYPFWVSLFQKMKIVSFRGNWVLSLTQI